MDVAERCPRHTPHPLSVDTVWCWGAPVGRSRVAVASLVQVCFDLNLFVYLFRRWYLGRLDLELFLNTINTV